MILINTICKKKTFDKLLNQLLKNYNNTETIFLLDNLKSLFFNFTTKAGFSLSLEDFHGLNLNKRNIIKKSNKNFLIIQNYNEFNKNWNTTNFITRQFLINYLKNSDYYNHLLLMSFSGARGTPDQIYQIIGNRGLITDVQGEVKKNFITTSFNQGLTLLDYLISAFGARKGVIDTALKTADSGYLTRRLVETTFNLVVKTFSCNSRIFFVNKNLNELNLYKTSLNCSIYNSFCKKCVLFKSNIGSAIGILASQSISEPSTQLTMRTFHTGGSLTKSSNESWEKFNLGFLYNIVTLSNIFVKNINKSKITFFILNNIFDKNVLKLLIKINNNLYLTKYNKIYYKIMVQLKIFNSYDKI